MIRRLRLGPTPNILYISTIDIGTRRVFVVATVLNIVGYLGLLLLRAGCTPTWLARLKMSPDIVRCLEWGEERRSKIPSPSRLKLPLYTN